MASKASGKAKRNREDPPDVKLSKFISYICRHGAEKEGITLLSGGYVAVSAILSHRRGKQHTEEDVRRVVTNCPKSRFALTEMSGQLLIRANQGHTLQVDDLELTPILRAEDAPTVVHGTNKKAWGSIQAEGLSRMKRNHIHFATGLPGESGVISGMRSSSHVLIFVDMQKALDGGFQFYRSSNDVILCPGNEHGILPPIYFSEVRTN
ncbi:tRNA 2'-phosphotransferase 1-like [Halichondria panicea]|uniref:tRNA 2'-phosphotransferase 1-like n=1 Tax=Halichondria panicea TaxID=6063 RepID=UPI00312B9D7E